AEVDDALLYQQDDHILQHADHLKVSLPQLQQLSMDLTACLQPASELFALYRQLSGHAFEGATLHPEQQTFSIPLHIHHIVLPARHVARCHYIHSEDSRLTTANRLRFAWATTVWAAAA